MESLKTCSICSSESSLDFFEKDKRKKDGHGGRHRSCKYRQDYASIKERHSVLVAKMGSACACCGVIEDLQIDHKNGKEWRSNRLSWRARVLRMEREYAAGVQLQVLCRSCNEKKELGEKCNCGGAVPVAVQSSG